MLLEQSPYDALIQTPGYPGQQPAWFLAGANQWPDPVLVTTHFSAPPQPFPSAADNHALGLLSPPIARRGVNPQPPDTTATPVPWQPGAFPTSYAGLRAPRPNEAVYGPLYNPAEPLGLEG